MRYMPLRIDDERSSELCRAIERLALEKGGLEFPFSIYEHRYGVDTLNAGLNATGYRTGVFHENCRCNLVPISPELAERQPDFLDMEVMIGSAITDVNVDRVQLEDGIRFSPNRIFNTLKLLMTGFFRRFRKPE